jgi:hypothetical protein
MLGRFSLLEREARRGPSVGDEISTGGECAYFFWRGGTHVSVRELSEGERGAWGEEILVCCIGSTMSMAILVVFGIQIVFQEYILEL